MTEAALDGAAPEWFTFGARMFDITEAKRLLATEGPAEVLEAPVGDLTPMLIIVGVDPDAARALPDAALDQPLIAITDDNSRLLIDGYHRLYAAQQRGRPTLPVHVLGAEQSKRVEHIK